jgi:pantoate--beta-alanine ligase
VERARRENEVVVISIFVNPAQFAPNEDFNSYPRNWEKDRDMIESLKLHTAAVFMPTAQEMYPSGISMQRDEQIGSFVEVLGLSETVFSEEFSSDQLVGRRISTSLFPWCGDGSLKVIQYRPA